MTKAEFVQLLKLRLGSRDDSDLDPLIALEASVAQRELERSPGRPWFLLTLNVPLTISKNVREVSWPTGFLAEFEDGAVRVKDSEGNWWDLEKGDYDSSLKYWGREKGFPRGYSDTGLTLQLFPIPDAAYEASVDCYMADVSVGGLVDSGTNKWLTYASDALMAKTGLRLATYIRDPELAQIFAGELAAALQRLNVESVARFEENRVRRMEG